MEKEIDSLRSVVSVLIKDSLKPIKQTSTGETSSSRSSVDQQDVKQSINGKVHTNKPKTTKHSTRKSTTDQKCSSIQSKSSETQSNPPMKADAFQRSPLQQSTDQSKSTSVQSTNEVRSTKNPIAYDINYLKSLRYSSHSLKKPKFNRSEDFNQIINSSELRYIQISYPYCLDSIERGWRLNCDLSDRSLVNRARELLNKLGSENFDDLAMQFAHLRIKNEHELQQLVDLIYDKVIDDSERCESYVKLCRMPHLVCCDKQGYRRTIRLDILLMQKCQICFESAIIHRSVQERHQNEIDKCDDKEKKQHLIQYLSMEISLFRLKSIANTKLIGALYKSNPLYGIFIDSCIDKLIASDEFECLCILLKLIGEKYEKNTMNKDKFSQQVIYLEHVLRRRTIDMKLKFSIMEIIYMSKRGWKSSKVSYGF